MFSVKFTLTIVFYPKSNYETRHKLKLNQRFLLKPLALVTHIGLILTLTSGIDYYFSEISLNMWSFILLGFMLVEILVSLLHFQEQSLLRLLSKNSWEFGLGFATLSYILLWFNSVSYTHLRAHET